MPVRQPPHGKPNGKRATSSKSSGTKSSARSTISSPARHAAAADATDDLVAKMEGAQALVEAVPFNANKANEYGKARPTRSQAWPSRAPIPAPPAAR